jgi:translocation and assembly module TamA
VAALLAAAVLLPGRAAWGNGAASPPVPDTARGETAPPEDAASAPERPAFDIRVEAADAHLRALIERHNELQRYRVVADLDDSELARLLALAERDVRRLLATEGYFNPEVTLRRVDAPCATAGAVPPAPTLPAQAGRGGDCPRPTVVIAIEPGQAARVRQVGIEFAGDIATSADADARQQRAHIVSDWSLSGGRRFTQARWSDAKTQALRQLVERRYPRGQISYSLADVDAPQAAAALGLRLDSGPLFRLGPAVTRGARRYPDDLPERLSWLKPGDVYDQKKLVEAQQRLASSGYYDSAYISIDPEGDPNAAPVTYAVTEAPRHKLQLGVGYSTDSGPRLSAQHRDNTVFGTSWRAESKLNLDHKAPLLQTELTSLPDAGGWRQAVFARYMRQDDGSLVTTSQTVRAGLMNAAEQYDRNVYLQFDHALVTGAASVNAPDALVGEGAAISANYNWSRRYFDALPAPKSGFGLQAEAGLGMTVGSQSKPFARLNGRWLGLLPVGKSGSALSLRGELGAVLAADSARLPGTYLFRTGGDNSVRGYAYRGIGIPLGGHWVGPGRYLAVSSVQWQRPVLQKRYPGLLEHTLFVDVGGVANRVGDLRAHWGVGTGVRVNSPAGPIELSLAYGLQSREVRLHMTMGFSF